VFIRKGDFMKLYKLLFLLLLLFSQDLSEQIRSRGKTFFSQENLKVLNFNSLFRNISCFSSFFTSIDSTKTLGKIRNIRGDLQDSRDLKCNYDSRLVNLRQDLRQDFLSCGVKNSNQEWYFDFTPDYAESEVRFVKNYDQAKSSCQKNNSNFLRESYLKEKDLIDSCFVASDNNVLSGSLLGDVYRNSNFYPYSFADKKNILQRNINQAEAKLVSDACQSSLSSFK
jgi:hypothetical protein